MPLLGCCLTVGENKSLGSCTKKSRSGHLKKQQHENANNEEIRNVPVAVVFCSSLILLKCIQYSTRFPPLLEFSPQERLCVICV